MPAPPTAELALASGVAGREGRTLLLQAPAYRVSLAEDGALTLRADDYHCAVAPEELHAGFMTGDNRAAAQAATRLEIEALFGNAESAGRTDRRLSRSTPARTSPTSPGPALAIRDAQGAITPLFEVPEGSETAALEARLRALIRGTYRPVLEGKCGPLPEPLRDDD